jgi:hypothetical protein
MHSYAVIHQFSLFPPHDDTVASLCKYTCELCVSCTESATVKTITAGC